VVDGQRDVGGERFPDGLAVLPRLGDGQFLEVGLHAVRDAVEDVGAFGGRGAAPGGRRAVRGVERALHVVGGAAGDLAERLARDGRRVVEVGTARRRHVLAADPVVVAGLIGHQGVGLARRCVAGHR
jgi:hypothetical protein